MLSLKNLNSKKFIIGNLLIFSFIIQSMTLESYLDEYSKRKIKKNICKNFICECQDIKKKTNAICPNTLANNCFINAECKMQNTGTCGYNFDKNLINCLNNSDYCIRAGFYKEMCIKNKGKPFFFPKVYKPENQCFKDATCELQKNGQCSFTITTKIIKCLRKLR